MPILVLNCGSSSVKAALYEGGVYAQEMRRLAAMHLKIKSSGKHVLEIYRSDDKNNSAKEDSSVLSGERKAVTAKAIETLLAKHPAIDLIVHRVVHGGAYTAASMLTDKVIDEIKALGEFAPLHNPVSLEAIQSMSEALPAVPQAACFDTAFHRTIPREAAIYAIPREIGEKLKIERYGFHGINCQYIVERLSALTNQSKDSAKVLAATQPGSQSKDDACSTRRAPRNNRPSAETNKTLICHLGAGASLTAVVDGQSVNNTMGFTPLDGLVMGTRVGAIDPGAVLYLMRKQNLSAEAGEKYLNSECGLKGLTGESDMQKIEQLADGGDAQAIEALSIYQHRLKTQAGAMIASMGGLDTIVFTGGIGENSAKVRRSLCQDLDYLGVKIDENLNAPAKSNKDQDKEASQDRAIQANESTAQIWVIAADEELFMAKQGLALIKS